MLIVFIVVFIVVWGGLDLFRALTSRQRMQLATVLAYSTFVAAITAALIGGIVLLF